MDIGRMKIVMHGDGGKVCVLGCRQILLPYSQFEIVLRNET